MFNPKEIAKDRLKHQEIPWAPPINFEELELLKKVINELQEDYDNSQGLFRAKRAAEISKLLRCFQEINVIIYLLDHFTKKAFKFECIAFIINEFGGNFPFWLLNYDIQSLIFELEIAKHVKEQKNN